MNDTESVFEAIVNLRGDISTVSSGLSGVQTDIDWIKITIKEIADNQKACSACKNSKELTDKVNKLTTERNIVYGIAIAVAILVNILAFYFQTWGKPS